MTAHCNACNKPFEITEMRTRKFDGQAAIRTSEFHTCPHCGRMDVHWFFASDEMPAGLNYRQQSRWQENN